MGPPCRILLLALLLLAAGSPGRADEPRTETAWGLHSTTFDTLHGRVVVTVSDDAAPGDTLSGRVLLDPAGEDDATRSANLDRLEGYVVELGNQRVEVSADRYRWVVPAALATTAPVALRGDGGTRLGETSVPLRAAPGSGATGFELPDVAQAGRPVTIAGPFDGDLADAGVTVGGTEANVLAESPRQLVVEAPADAVGPTEIVVTEGGTSAQGELRVVALGLSAPKVDLRRGERTTLTVRVSGLSGLDEPLSVEVVNRSPDRVRIRGGESQGFTIRPEEVAASGDFTWETRLTGVAPGGFQITAYLPSVAHPGGETGLEPVADVEDEPAQRRAAAQDAPTEPERTVGVEDLEDVDQRVTLGPGYDYVGAPKCCCPRHLEIRREGELEGDWRISEYWPENLPVWGERTGPAEGDVSNDDWLGPTDVPQVLEHDRKEEYESDDLRDLYEDGMEPKGLPPRPEESVRKQASPHNIGHRYQMIADYEWIDSTAEHFCAFHWMKQNRCTELRDEDGNLKRDFDGKWANCTGDVVESQYALQRPGGFEADRWGGANTRTLPEGRGRPDRQLWVDPAQRVHERGEEPDEPIHFRWWIEAHPSCDCRTPFLGAEGTLGFERIPGSDYPRARWLHFREDLTSEDQFTPRTHHPE